MSFTPNIIQQEQLAEVLERPKQRLTRSERLAEAITIGGFALVTGGLWISRPPHGFELWPAVLCMALLVLATRVQFETPFGFTVATQLAFIPLLFALPVAVVPIAVVISLMAAAMPEVITGEVRPTRLMVRVGNAWFAFGPAVVFALASTTPREANGWLLLGALAAQFAVDFVTSTVRFAIAQKATVRDQLKDSWVYLIDAALSGVGLVVAEQLHDAPYAPLALLPLMGLLAVFAHERSTRLEQLLELNSAYRGTAMVLGNVVDADDGYTGEHCRSVVALCLDVAKRLGVTAEQMRNLEFGALLHDLGKIAIPKEIINKPGKLNDEEWTIIRTHTVEGQKLLDTVGGFMRDVGLIVRSHHERWDGTGYPDQLGGEKIPVESRIISACDTWNAMRTHRSYRNALSFEVASHEMESISGTQLDPRVVAALLQVVRVELTPPTERATALPSTDPPAEGRTANQGLTAS